MAILEKMCIFGWKEESDVSPVTLKIGTTEIICL